MTPLYVRVTNISLYVRVLKLDLTTLVCVKTVAIRLDWLQLYPLQKYNIKYNTKYYIKYY